MIKRLRELAPPILEATAEGFLAHLGEKESLSDEYVLSMHYGNHFKNNNLRERREWVSRFDESRRERFFTTIKYEARFCLRTKHKLRAYCHQGLDIAVPSAYDYSSATTGRSARCYEILKTPPKFSRGDMVYEVFPQGRVKLYLVVSQDSRTQKHGNSRAYDVWCEGEQRILPKFEHMLNKLKPEELINASKRRRRSGVADSCNTRGGRSA